MCWHCPSCDTHIYANDATMLDHNITMHDEQVHRLSLLHASDDVLTTQADDLPADI